MAAEIDSIVEITTPTIVPNYYTELNTAWKTTFKPRKFNENTDLVLTETYDIVLPELSEELDPRLKKAIKDQFELYILPVFEDIKRRKEYKQLQIMLEWKKSELNNGPALKLVYENKKLTLTNKQEIKNFISDIEPEEKRNQLRFEFYEIEDKIELLNNSPEIYDVIIYLNLHGLLIPYHDLDESYPTIDFGFRQDPKGQCMQGVFPICSPTNSDATVTFLTVTKPGVNHMVDKPLSRQIEMLVESQLEDKNTVDVLKLQNDLRTLKQRFITKINSTPSSRKIIMDKFGEGWKKFESDKGWGITTNKWLNKILVPDPKQFGDIPIKIFYDEPIIAGPLNKDLFSEIIKTHDRSDRVLRDDKQPPVTTSEVVNYLIDHNRKNILVIDASCYEQIFYVDEDKDRFERRLVSEARKQGVAGGTRKRSKKRKSKRFKR